MEPGGHLIGHCWLPRHAQKGLLYRVFRIGPVTPLACVKPKRPGVGVEQVSQCLGPD